MSRRRGLIIVLVGLCVVVVLAVVAYKSVLPPRQINTVDVPANSARPDAVVAAYLKALDAHDCGAVEALTIQAAAAVGESWCGAVASISDVYIESAQSMSARGSGGNATVVVSFELSWRLFRGEDGLDEGPTSMNYELTRGSSDAPWRIYDQEAS